MRTYLAKEIEEISNGPNVGSSIRVGVFIVEDGLERQIGTYVRNYSILFDTFFPFEKNGKELALYSPDYTVTRLMELPACVDIGGEEPASNGFCPTGFYVPS